MADETAAVRKKSEKRQRGKLKAIRFLDEEFNTAAAKASAAGMSFGAYIRAAATGNAGPRAQRRLPVDADMMRRVLGEHGRIGNNMNQIAFALNAYGERGLEADFRAALQEWGDLRDMMLAALGRSVEPTHDR